MLIALGLVLVMMRQASKPEIYEPFFGPLRSGSQIPATSPSGQVDATGSIDQSITAQVVDGSVWRSGDLTALYLYLNQAESFSGSDGPLVGALPLLQQPEVFLNKLVRVRGTVVRSELIEAQENQYGITEFWQLWIRPSDGADRPMLLLVNAVPDQVAAVGPDAIDENGPAVFASGWFLKRLAYQSSRGADLAPVIVGKLLSNSTLAEKDPSTVPLIDRAPLSQTRLGVLLALSTLVGLLLAALAIWRTTKLANRTREIRLSRSRNPDAFLRSLEASSSDDGNAT